MMCPKCRGTMFYNKTREGPEWSCVNCGYVDYGHRPLPFIKAGRPRKLIVERGTEK